MVIRQFVVPNNISFVKSLFHCVAVLILLINPGKGFSQVFVSPEVVQKAEEAIQNLKKGTLVVRLYTNHKSIDTLEAMAKRSKHNAIAFERKINEIKDSRDYENKEIIKALSKHYGFSKIVFVPDYNFKDYISGKTKEIAWDKDLKAIDVDYSPEYFLTLTRIQGESYDWLIQTEDGLVLDDPFPNFFKLNPALIQFINGAFKPKQKIPAEKYDLLAQKVNQDLEDYLVTATW